MNKLDFVKALRDLTPELPINVSTRLFDAMDAEERVMFAKAISLALASEKVHAYTRGVQTVADHLPAMSTPVPDRLGIARDLLTAMYANPNEGIVNMDPATAVSFAIRSADGLIAGVNASTEPEDES